MGGGGARWLVENGGCFHEHLGVVESIGEESELIVLFVWGFIPVTGSFIRLLDYNLTAESRLASSYNKRERIRVSSQRCNDANIASIELMKVTERNEHESLV